MANSLRALWITTAVYAVLVISLLSYKPLWLDEMLTLVEVRLPTTAEMMRELPAVPGSSPLTFLEQRYLLNARAGVGNRKQPYGSNSVTAFTA